MLEKKISGAWEVENKWEIRVNMDDIEWENIYVLDIHLELPKSTF